jgi:carbon-monoxide dehydrogenase medium subunit
MGGDARVLAGGQSLMPLMHFRLASPANLIDINRVDELDYISRTNGTLAIGARTRQAQLLASEEAAEVAPLLVDAIGHVGHAQIRHRGTVAGSAAHADPSAEIPAVLLALGAEMQCSGSSGDRTVAAADFYTGPFQTALADDEILTEIRVPAWPGGTGAAWLELTRIYHGFPVVGVGALIHLEDGTIDQAAVAMCGMAATPIGSRAAADVLVGQSPSAELIEDAASAAVADLNPPADVHGSTSYRLRAGRAYVRRTLEAAITNAGGTL